MPDLRFRKYEDELMDDLSAGGEVMDITLKELDIINRLLGGNQATINPVKSYLLKHTGKTHTIVDLGCGSGEMLRKLSSWADDNNIDVDLIGIDANPHVIQYARQHSAGYENVTYRCLDVFSEEVKSLKPDIFLSTLFLHHFDEDQLSYLIGMMYENSQLVVINDIHRHWFAFYSIRLLTLLFSNSEMVRNDASLSVERAFRRNDLEVILKEAKIENFRFAWKWAFRLQLILD